MHYIGSKSANLKQISDVLRQTPLVGLRQMLSDGDILRACEEVSHRYRRRLYDPVVTVFHFLLQAIQREVSFAGTLEELWSNVLADFGLEKCKLNYSALSQARSRLPKAVFDILIDSTRAVDETSFCMWNGFRVLALDSTTLSMPRGKALFEYFGAHKARTTTVRYPLGTFCSLLSVGTSLVVGHRFGPFDPGELKTATPLLQNLHKGDLLLADRQFSGSPTIARIHKRRADFLMRKNAKLIVARLPVLKRLGRDDFITRIPMNKLALRLDPSLPKSVRVRIFKAWWRSPAGEKLQQWFVTSLKNRKRFPPRMLANFYYRRWRIETSYNEFKVLFHADVLRSKTVDNVKKEVAAHVLTYQLLRRLMVRAAKKHDKQPTEISFLNAARWVVSFSSRMSIAPSDKLALMYERLLEAIATTQVDIRPGRLEPRALTREWKHYPRLRISRPEWRASKLRGTG